ncbi:MAG: NADH-quinone oxidoreductase subunit NuoF [Dehalococcoidales bacterium]|nr:NADH-quinone oxidoreductase subunit NuoF [Dehalococcoidales bacterium]
MTFETLRSRALAEWDALQKLDKPRLLVGAATCGLASGAEQVIKTINEELAKNHIDAVVTRVGCIGLCYAEPIVDIIKPGQPRITYSKVTPEVAVKLIKDYLIAGNPRPDLAMGTHGDKTIKDIPKFWELPVLKSQIRIALRNCGNIDPEDINQYIANGGYSGIERALKMTQAEVIAETKKSGLKGRGGAGFSTGQKWDFCNKSPGNVKYLICNADEGDPGAFVNRSLLESDPHSVLEGMLIAAYAIGANFGYIYCRAEYPLAIERLQNALAQMRQNNLLGDNIMGSGFNFEIVIKEGAGAFVCGEETALMASIEGRRGMPRPRPPFPANSGLWGKPSNINNVETFSNASIIFQKNADWFAGFGTESSKGTKGFSLSGKAVRTGLVEVPMGIPLGDIIYDIGGGIVKGKKFKGVLTGGPSGGCLPASKLDLPVDYEQLAKAGSIMGSGGMVVADEDTCIVDMARFFLTFTQDESCGKCVPCRVGTKQMLQILERITRGEGVPDDIRKLEKLAGTIKNTSLCALGQSAPNPVLTTLKYFREEYEEHIVKKHCRAGVCTKLVKSPCQNACPAGIDIPRYIRLIGKGKYGEAVAVIREKVPFPATLGYVCVHFCEAKCRRGQLEEAIGIKELKRFAADRDTGIWKKNSKVAPPTGKKVAVIGSGPSGLTAGFYLTKKGHKVTVFESLPQAGGMMRVGIPRYRLPAEILDKEIKDISDTGVEIKLNSRVESVDELFKQGFDSVYIATGAHKANAMGMEGENSAGVIDGVQFLRQVSLGEKVKVGKTVVVVGGGNVAIDAARTALRLGAAKVTIVYRRTRAEMPASAEEIEAAVKEGIKLELLTNPSKATVDNGKLKVELIKMALGKVDTSGRPRPEPIKGSEYTLECDMLIKAIGQESDTPAGFGVTTARGGRIAANPDTLVTSKQGVYAGGDVVAGPASVIEAIEDGRKAAMAIDKFLGGNGSIEETLAPQEETPKYVPPEIDHDEFRPELQEMLVGKRITCFALAELGWSDKDGIKETDRCLRCDLEAH